MTVTIEDLSCPRGDGSSMAIRLYRPCGSGPFPALVGVHGGMWVGGDRTANADAHRWFADRGIAVAVLEFGKPPAVRYPVPVADVHLGVRWVKAHAVELGAHPDLIGGLGWSSGGHQLLLATLWQQDPRYAMWQPDEAAGATADVAFIAACWPVAEPLSRYRMAVERGRADLVAAHDAYWPDEAAMAEGSPVLRLEREGPRALPPLLVIQGSADENLPAGSARRLAAAYEAAGGTVGLEEFPGEPHAFVSRRFASAPARQALESIARFANGPG